MRDAEQGGRTFDAVVLGAGSAGRFGCVTNRDVAPAKPKFDLATGAWQAARRERPSLGTGFWCCLAGDAETCLKQNVVDYLKIVDGNVAKLIAESMTATRDLTERAANIVATC